MWKNYGQPSHTQIVYKGLICHIYVSLLQGDMLLCQNASRLRRITINNEDLPINRAGKSLMNIEVSSWENYQTNAESIERNTLWDFVAKPWNIAYS